MPLIIFLLCLLPGVTPKECNTTTPAAASSTTAITFTQDCSIPHCRVFKNGNLVFFPGKDSFTLKNIDDSCADNNGEIFVPKTEEDNRIWFEYTRALYNEDNSFEYFFYPMWCHFYDEEIVCYQYDRANSRVRVTGSDYVPKIDDPNDGQVYLDEVDIRDYNQEGVIHLYFVHDIKNYYGQLQYRNGSKPIGVAICIAGGS